jgi:tetratricopeptide (TPR) repeat protein
MNPPSNSRLERLGSFLQVDPDNVQLLRDYANEALRAREFEACVRAIDKLHALNAMTEQEALLLAACRFYERDFEAALQALPELPPTHPSAADACALRVRLLHHLERLDEALALANEFRASQPVPPVPVIRAMLAVLMDLSRMDDAEVLARSLLQGSPDAGFYEVCEPLAAAALDRDDFETARQWTDRALAVRQDDGRVWLLQGLAQLRAGATAQAEAAFQRACELMPTHPGSSLALGWTFLATRDLDRAEAAFNNAVQASPSFAEAHGSLAVVAAMRKQSSQATQHIRRAQRLDAHCASAQWAQHLLSGNADPEQVSRLAAQVVAQVRSQREPLSEGGAARPH